MKKISLTQIEKKHKITTYSDLHRFVMEEINIGRIKPVKASKTNGKSPALFNQYWMVEEEQDYSEYRKELLYLLHPAIHTDYYMKHTEEYVKDRDYVIDLSNYLKEKTDKMQQRYSMNERSFDIWGREKFLQKEQGRKILKHCGVEEEQLSFYHTTEPLCYYSFSKSTPQNILIIENLDTFYSIRRYMISGKNDVFGCAIDTVIYGSGKSFFKSVSDFDICVEPYMTDEQNTYLYFGDMDYEGIGIYERLKEQLSGKLELLPFVPAYEKMLERSVQFRLPETKKNQNRNLNGVFWSFFKEESVNKMREILEAERYIPQEIINISDIKEE